MKLLFVHDVKALIYNEEVYARSYGKNIMNRYLACFEKIQFCSRSRNAIKSEIVGIEQLTSDSVTFEKRIGMFKGPDAFVNRRIKKILFEDIDNSDGVVLRLDSFLGLIAADYCRKNKKPYIIEVVGCAWDSFWNHGVSGKILAPFMFYSMKRAVAKSKYCVYVTSEFLQKRYPTKGSNTNISNVELPELDDSIITNRLKRIRKIDKKSIINITTVANVGVRYKGMHFVVKALYILKCKGFINYKYHMIGEGNQEYIKKIAKEYDVFDMIEFHGPLKHEDVLDFLKESTDIYIQPSLQEGLPRALIEAMSCATPCIGSNVAGIPELLDKNFVFNRKQNIEKQISNMLESFSALLMIEQAKRNFVESHKYQKQILSDRRTAFFNDFIQKEIIKDA